MIIISTVRIFDYFYNEFFDNFRFYFTVFTCFWWRYNFVHRIVRLFELRVPKEIFSKLIFSSEKNQV